MCHPAIPLPRSEGFSLLEMAVALAIIGVLSAFLIPAVSRARQNASLATCVANQRAIYHGLQSYANDNDGRLPTSMNNGSSWQSRVASYLGIVIPKGQTPGAPPCDRNVFLCPSVINDAKPQRSYALNSRAGDKSGETDEVPVRIAQPSRTALLADALNTSWLMATNRISFRHRNNSANVLFFDGHVEAMSATQIANTTSWVFIDGEDP